MIYSDGSADVKCPKHRSIIENSLMAGHKISTLTYRVDPQHVKVEGVIWCGLGLHPNSWFGSYMIARENDSDTDVRAALSGLSKRYLSEHNEEKPNG